MVSGFCCAGCEFTLPPKLTGVPPVVIPAEAATTLRGTRNYSVA